MTEYRVIHIDNDRAFLDRSVTTLQRRPSLDIIGETSPQAGLQRLRENHGTDCLVAEYELTEMNGLELLDQVRETHPDVPFILFTATGSEELASRAISAGVTDYLSKHDGADPFELLANRIRNYAERYRTQQSLERENRRNKYALRAVSDVVWERDPETEKVHVSEGFSELTGYSLDDGSLSFEWWIDRIHPDDRDRIRSNFQTQLTAGQQTFSGKYRFRRADGSYIVVEDDGYVISDTDGEPRKMIGAIRDITARQERKQELERY